MSLQLPSDLLLRIQVDGEKHTSTILHYDNQTRDLCIWFWYVSPSVQLAVTEYLFAS